MTPPQSLIRGMERSWSIGSGVAEHSKSLSRMALILTLVNGGQLVSGDKEKGLASRFGGKLGAGPKALLLPSWWMRQKEVQIAIALCEDSCLLQSQLWARSGLHRSHLLARGWQDDPSLALHGSSEFLHCAVQWRNSPPTLASPTKVGHTFQLPLKVFSLPPKGSHPHLSWAKLSADRERDSIRKPWTLCHTP